MSVSFGPCKFDNFNRPSFFLIHDLLISLIDKILPLKLSIHYTFKYMFRVQVFLTLKYLQREKEKLSNL